VAAVCAHRAGKFWEYARLLYGNRHKHNARELENLAAKTGMERAAFRSCLRDPATIREVIRQAKIGHRLGVRGTPTFVINGVVFTGARSKAKLLKLLKRFEKGNEHGDQKHGYDSL
jgi:predicted DsbA family dithiol-disulfide isomerase